jgi:hypothetical protein
MYECSRDQDTGTEVLSTKQKGRRDSKTRKLDHENRKRAACRRYEQDDE